MPRRARAPDEPKLSVRCLAEREATRAGGARAAPSALLQLDLQAELDDAVGGQIEELGRGARVLGQESEEDLAPAGDAGLARGEQRLAAEVVGRLGRVGDQAEALAARK